MVDLSVMVWGGICGQQRTDLTVIDGNCTAHRYLHMVDIHAIETWSLWSNVLVVLYEITHFTPSAVVNCDIIILLVLLSILVFIYCQIIILSKYNIYINLLFLIL